MFRLSRAPTECFFCQTPIPAGVNPRSFKCAACSCWNRYDTKGEIMSDEPAMHDPSLNKRSFARRASSRKDRLPTEFQRRNVFCHTCQTNQHLLVNLLANFLPSDPSDPEYAQRLEELPAYKNSLQARYPPVCESCASLVEQEIEEKNRMARTSALTGFLKETKGKEKARKVSASIQRKEARELRTLVWIVRGCLWGVTTTASIGTCAYVAWGHNLPTIHPSANQVTALALPSVVFLSILWSFWDPTYIKMQKYYIQGKEMRLKGRNQYIKLQMTAWGWRLLTACMFSFPARQPSTFLWDSSQRTRIYFALQLIVELSILVFSIFGLQIKRPPKVRLLDTSMPRALSKTPSLDSRSPTPGPSRTLEMDLLAPLSLSGNPILPAQPSNQPSHNPIFGLPSLFSSSSSSPQSSRPLDEDTEMLDEDAMDWTPTEPLPPTQLPLRHVNAPPSRISRREQEEDDGSWMRPQRFFAPEAPTGLEGLLSRTGLTDVAGPSANDAAEAHALHRAGEQWRWGWVYVLSLVPVIGALGYQLRNIRGLA